MIQPLPTAIKNCIKSFEIIDLFFKIPLWECEKMVSKPKNQSINFGAVSLRSKDINLSKQISFAPRLSASPTPVISKT